MKAKLLMATVVVVLLVGTSCKSKSQKEAQNYMDQVEKTMKENSPPEGSAGRAANVENFVLPEGMKNIVGDWQLVRVFGDKNGNHQVDPEEEKDAFTNMKDLLILNSNGSCEYTIARMDGRYEIVTKDDGRKKLVMYDRTGTEVNRGRY